MGIRIALRDGRKVELEEYGDPAGVPALWFHGAFSSRLEGGFLDVPARGLGLRLFSLDRPGVGGSDPLPGRTAIGYAADVAEVLDALDVDRAAIGGLSNGGMFAMAVGSQIPDRVLRVVPVNSTTPTFDAASKAAISRRARMQYRYLLRDPDAVIRRLEKAKVPGRLAAALTRLTNPDAHLFEDPTIAAARAANHREVLRQSVGDYLRCELNLAAGPWGFDHRAVPAPVAIVSGQKDAGLGYAKIWAQELPMGRLVVVPGGHSAIFAPGVGRRVTEILCGRA